MIYIAIIVSISISDGSNNFNIKVVMKPWSLKYSFKVDQC